LHGGAIATLVDVACSSCGAMALDFNPVTHLIVTTDLHVRYLGRAKGQTVRADARVIRAGSSMTTVECRVADELGNLVASADMAIMQIPRRDAPGVPSS
jgi:uncharacterized protein (TIGR00369 family)